MKLFFVRTPLRPRHLLQAAPLALILLNLSSAHAQTKPAEKKIPAVKHAEAILGKPLSETQKKAIRAAASKRQKAIKPIQEKFRLEASKALGLSLAQYTDREKKLHPKKGAGR